MNQIKNILEKTEYLKDQISNYNPMKEFCKKHGCDFSTQQSCCGCPEYFKEKEKYKIYY